MRNRGLLSILILLANLPARAADLQPLAQAQAAPFRAERMGAAPIISRRTFTDARIPEDGNNINGPSLIRVPEWVSNPLGKYYLYFANHSGKYIRMAYADKLEGPWKLRAGGVLALADGPGQGHIASPDVLIDEQKKQIRMYFHQPADKQGMKNISWARTQAQVSFVSVSSDGLKFNARPDILGPSYFRVFQYGDAYYSLSKNNNKDGIISRSKDGLSAFEEGPHFMPNVRHTAVWVDGNTLHVLYTMVGETNERIYYTHMDLSGDWKQWQLSPGQMLLEAQTDYEGVNLPLTKSDHGRSPGPEHALRDPAYFAEDGRRYMLYSVMGEQGIAIAELKEAAQK